MYATDVRLFYMRIRSMYVHYIFRYGVWVHVHVHTGDGWGHLLWAEKQRKRTPLTDAAWHLSPAYILVQLQQELNLFSTLRPTTDTQDLLFCACMYKCTSPLGFNWGNVKTHGGEKKRTRNRFVRGVLELVSQEPPPTPHLESFDDWWCLKLPTLVRHRTISFSPSFISHLKTPSVQLCNSLSTWYSLYDMRKDNRLDLNIRGKWHIILHIRNQNSRKQDPESHTALWPIGCIDCLYGSCRLTILTQATYYTSDET